MGTGFDIPVNLAYGIPWQPASQDALSSNLPLLTNKNAQAYDSFHPFASPNSTVDQVSRPSEPLIAPVGKAEAKEKSNSTLSPAGLVVGVVGTSAVLGLFGLALLTRGKVKPKPPLATTSPIKRSLTAPQPMSSRLSKPVAPAKPTTPLATSSPIKRSLAAPQPMSSRLSKPVAPEKPDFRASQSGLVQKPRQRPLETRPASGIATPVAPVRTAPILREFTATQALGDLSKVRYSQKSRTASCYLNASFSSILHNPNGAKLFDQIKIAQTETGYAVKFPGQPRAIPVTRRELVNATIDTDNLGLQLIDRAYYKIPGAAREDEFDTANLAMRRIFGHRIATDQSASANIANYHETNRIDDKAYLYVATKVKEAFRPSALKAMTPAARQALFKSSSGSNDYQHYYSVQFGAKKGDPISLIDPFAPHNSARTQTLSLSEFEDQFKPERITILKTPT